MDLRELGEFLENMELDLIGAMALEDYYVNWKDGKKVQWLMNVTHVSVIILSSSIFLYFASGYIN